MIAPPVSRDVRRVNRSINVLTVLVMKSILLQAALALTAVVALSACHGEKKPTPPAVVRVETAVAGETASGTAGNYSGTVEESSGTVAKPSACPAPSRLSMSRPATTSRKGRLIATVDAANLRNAYDISHSALAQAQDAYDRMKMLHDAEAIADIKWVEMQQTLKQARVPRR